MRQLFARPPAQTALPGMKMLLNLLSPPWHMRPCHLSCVPKKGDPKKGTRRKFFTACSVVLSTFRKLALRAQTVRNASPSDSVAWLNFRMGSMQETSIQIFTQTPRVPGADLRNFGAPVLAKEASRRANAHWLRPQAEFARSSGRCLRRVHNFVQAGKGMCKKTASFKINRVKTRYKSPTPNPEDPH